MDVVRETNGALSADQKRGERVEEEESELKRWQGTAEQKTNPIVLTTLTFFAQSSINYQINVAGVRLVHDGDF